MTRIPTLHGWRNVLGSLLELAAVGACTATLALTLIGIIMLLLTGNKAGGRDFVSYWAAGHQLAQHRNPYDSAAILEMERSVGLRPDIREVIMRNPPSALLLVLPLSFFGMQTGALVWSLLLIGCLIASVRLLGPSSSPIHLLGYSFGPALTCILAGQTALFALLGLVLFLRLHRTRPFLAGVSLWLCFLKPHLFIPFVVVLLVWVIATKTYRILLGASAALAASTAVALLLDPLVWVQYKTMMTTWGIEREVIPCISVMLRLLVQPDANWLQSLPTLLGCAWAIRYFATHRTVWRWPEHGGLLMLVSFLTTPYAWPTDGAILIPAILYAASLTRSKALIATLTLASAAIEAEVLFCVHLNSWMFTWTAPVWLAWYLCAIRTSDAQPSKEYPPLREVSF